MAVPLPIPLPQPVWCWLTLPLEDPFAWRYDSYSITSIRQIKFFPEGSNPTISFTTKRNSKFLGYLPLIGTFVGISRIYDGIREYKLFQNTHLHFLSGRSLKWIARGALESLPVMGGIICLIADVIATILNYNRANVSALKDATPCGYCHRCGFCRC